MASGRLKWETLVNADADASPAPRRHRVRPSRVAPPQPQPQPQPEPEPEPAPVPRQRRVLQHLLAGALAGATAKTVEAPLDRVKIIFQVSKQRFSLRAAVKQMVAIARSEGIQGLWKGNGASRRRGGGGSRALASPHAPPPARRDDVPRRAVRSHQLRGARNAFAGAAGPRCSAAAALTRPAASVADAAQL